MPGDDVGVGDGVQLGDPLKADEGNKLFNINSICAAGFGIGDVGEPFEVGRDLGQIAELRRCAAKVLSWRVRRAVARRRQAW